MRESITKTVCIIVFFVLQLSVGAQVKRIYVSNDDHTDYVWTEDEAGYDTLIPRMLDRWIFYNDSTKTANPTNPDLWSKWNCDGSFWVSTYKRKRSAAQFDALINQIRSGQITVPYSPLVSTYGGTPSEAVLRGMYYAGQLERDYTLDFNMAIAMENQTLPLGLTSLWKGAGAKYCWHGVCNCQTQIADLHNRQNEMYWYKGLDTNRILLKWYRLEDPDQNYYLGGYGEAMNASNAIDGLANKIDSPYYNNYNIAAGFGVGHDRHETLTDDLVPAAMSNTDPTRRIIVSNETDFFQDFETTYGASLPNVTQTFGNEWDLNCASIAEVSAKVKRSLEKLRSAEAMAAIVTNYEPTFAGLLNDMRKEAWESIGLYWEHSLGFDGGGVSLDARNAFQRRLENKISSYVDQLHALSKNKLGNLITNSVPANTRFFAFNALGWVRTGYADYAYNGAITPPLHVTDISTNIEIPSQIITRNGQQYIRIEAVNIPSVGYKIFQVEPGAVYAGFPIVGYNININNANNVVECDSFKVTFTNAGVLTSVIDKQHGNREMVEPGKYLNDLGSANSFTGLTPVLESNGPVSVTILTTSSVPVPHTTRITLYKNIARIEIDNQITQNFIDTKTWANSFNINDAEVWHEETGAVIRAKLTSHGGHYATQNARYDWSSLNHFASVNDTVTNYGITLSNQDCYFMKIGNSSISALNEGSAQLNVLVGGQIDNLGIPAQGGDGIFNQRFAITTHTSYSAAAEMKKALEHQDSMVCGAVVNPANFLLPNEYSYIKNNEPGTLLWALKPSEEPGEGTIARYWNLDNSDVNTTATFPLKINLAKRVTHVETDMTDITNTTINSNYSIPLGIGHNEMRSYRFQLTVLPLAVTSINLTGEKVFESNVLQWKVNNDKNYKTYELQRSADGQQFTTITSTPATGNVDYGFTDRNVDIAIPYYYRLKTTDLSNMPGYSNTVLIKAAKEASNIVLFPNPVKDILKANFIIDKKTRGQIAIYNTKGEMVKTVAPPLFERGNNYYILSIKELPAGAYIFSVTAEDKKYVKAFIKE